MVVRCRVTFARTFATVYPPLIPVEAVCPAIAGVRLVTVFVLLTLLTPIALPARGGGSYGSQAWDRSVLVLT